MEPSHAPHPLRVLVVDDCADMVSTLALLLRAWGHEPWTARDGPEALRRVAEGAPDVVLLDLAMPGMNGWDLAQRLRRVPGLEGALLIVMSGYCQEEDVARSRQAGCHAHLTKPFEPDRLRRLLSEYRKESTSDDPRATDGPPGRAGDGG